MTKRRKERKKERTIDRYLRGDRRYTSVCLDMVMRDESYPLGLMVERCVRRGDWR